VVVVYLSGVWGEEKVWEGVRGTVERVNEVKGDRKEDWIG
jgi:hypothetical protein